MKSTFRFLLLLLTVAVAVPTATAAAPPIALKIQVLSGAEPFTTQARVTIEPNEANRFFCLSWTQLQGGAQQRTSCQQIDGASSAKTYWQFLKELSSGKWDVVAYVLRNDESSHLSNRVLLHVLGPNYESE